MDDPTPSVRLLEEPSYVVTSLAPLLDLTKYLATSGMAFIGGTFRNLVCAKLDEGESGYAELSELATTQHGLSHKVGRMAAISRPGGDFNVTTGARLDEEKVRKDAACIHSCKADQDRRFTGD